jgi:hypothetical protein
VGSEVGNEVTSLFTRFWVRFLEPARGGGGGVICRALSAVHAVRPAVRPAVCAVRPAVRPRRALSAVRSIFSAEVQ